MNDLYFFIPVAEAVVTAVILTLLLDNYLHREYLRDMKRRADRKKANTHSK